MKRLQTLTTAALTLALLLALTACGGETDPAPDDGNDPDVGDVQVDPPGGENKDADLTVLRDQLVSDYQVAEAIHVDDADTLERLYGIEPGIIVSAVGFTASSDGAFPLEVMLVETANEDAAAGVEAKFRDRLDTIAEQAAAYDPESQELAEAAPVVKEGSYVAMFFTPDYDDMAGDFQAFVG